MTRRVKIVRSLNFAFPWSEREQFILPGRVRILVGAGALIVLLLVALPFVFHRMTQTEVEKRRDMTLMSNVLRKNLDTVAPTLAVKARLDSLKQLIDDRVVLYDQIAATDYPVDRLLLHLAEVLPESIVLTSIRMGPSAAVQGGRAGLQGQGQENLSPEIQALWVLTLQGTTRNADAISSLVEKLKGDLLFHQPQQQSVNMVAGTSRDLTFTITARLIGSGNKIEQEGGS